ncbi:MAG: hypothetical protein M3347_04150, partial [Armatimonadota bacterium]|nr:hypothetical protein [Armatimonadota bacterium]
TWLDWHEDFVVKGNNDQTREKIGTLIFLSPNQQTELARLNFFNLGIFRIAPDKSEAHADAIRRATVELYCERMEFVLPGAMADVMTKPPSEAAVLKPRTSPAIRIPGIIVPRRQ